MGVFSWIKESSSVRANTPATNCRNLHIVHSVFTIHSQRLWALETYLLKIWPPCLWSCDPLQAKSTNKQMQELLPCKRAIWNFHTVYVPSWTVILYIGSMEFSLLPSTVNSQGMHTASHVGTKLYIVTKSSLPTTSHRWNVQYWHLHSQIWSSAFKSPKSHAWCFYARAITVYDSIHFIECWYPNRSGSFQDKDQCLQFLWHMLA